MIEACLMTSKVKCFKVLNTLEKNKKKKLKNY